MPSTVPAVARRACRIAVCSLVALVLVQAPLAAGVVFEIETKDHDSSPPRVETSELAVEGSMLKMSIVDRKQGDGTAIFRGDRREMVVVDHDEKAYVVIDQAAIDAIGGQVSEAMKQVEEALAQVPEGQREAFRKMMEERMPKGAVGTGPSPLEVRETGERGTHAGYPCVRYDVLRDGQKVRELWVTDWSRVEGGAEVREAMRAMSDFFAQLMKKLQAGLDATPFGGVFLDTVPFAELREIDGFPVVTREFDGGELESESTLRSAGRRTLDPADFEPPAGYKRRSMISP